MEIILYRATTKPGSKAGAGQETLPASARELDWSSGQVLRGRVAARVAAGTYILAVDGREILARSASLLFQGQPVVMEVQERRGNQYMVKLLAGAGDTGDHVLKDIFDQLGLRDTPLHRSLIQGFLAQKLPLKPELLHRAGQMLQILGGHSREEMEVVLQALRLGVPPRADALEALRTFFVTTKDAGQEGITRLARFLPLLAELLDQVAGENKNEAGRLYQQVQAGIEALLLKPAEGREGLQEQLRQLLAAQLPGAGKEEENPAGQSSTGKSEGSKSEGPKGEQRPPAFSELLVKFSRLLQELRLGWPDTGEASTAMKILEEGEKIAGQLAGQQIFQLPGSERDLQDFLYFNLPLFKDGEVTSWGQLVIKKDGRGSRLIDPRNFNMAILVHTENLGTLLLEISVWHKEVRVQGKVQEEWVGSLINRAWPELQEAFAGLGYHLHGCEWQAGNLPQRLLPWQIEQAEVYGGWGVLDRKV